MLVTSLGEIRQLIREVSREMTSDGVLADLVELLPDWITRYVDPSDDAADSVRFIVPNDRLRREFGVDVTDPSQRIYNFVNEEITDLLEAEGFTFVATRHSIDRYDEWNREGITVFVTIMASFMKGRTGADGISVAFTVIPNT